MPIFYFRNKALTIVVRNYTNGDTKHHLTRKQILKFLDPAKLYVVSKIYFKWEKVSPRSTSTIA